MLLKGSEERCSVTARDQHWESIIDDGQSSLHSLAYLFLFIFSPSEAVYDVHDDGLSNVVESLSVVFYEVDQPAWAL